MADPAINRVRDFRRGFGVVDPTGKEVISATIWHRQTYTSASTTVLDFFQAVTTGQVGNLPLGGQLPNGNAFLIEAIRVGVLLDTTETAAANAADEPAKGALQDMVALIYNSTTELRVGDKDYSRWPTFMLPAGGGPAGFLQLTGTTTAPATSQTMFATNGIPDPRSVYSLPIPITIPPQYQFRVRVEWDAAQTIVSTNPEILVMLDGELMRPKQ